MDGLEISELISYFVFKPSSVVVDGFSRLSLYSLKFHSDSSRRARSLFITVVAHYLVLGMSKYGIENSMLHSIEWIDLSGANRISESKI